MEDKRIDKLEGHEVAWHEIDGHKINRHENARHVSSAGIYRLIFSRLRFIVAHL